MSRRAGVLIVGSLWWDRRGLRECWRATRLAPPPLPVPAPIRYGRRSWSRGNTFTMVLAEPGPAGTALLVPLRHPLETPADLLEEARLLWQAEAFEETERIGAEWGTVGLWCSDRELAEAWSRTPRTVPAGVRGIVGEDGLMRLPRPTPEDAELDPILVTVTAPTDPAASANEIAQAWIDGGHEHYFYETWLAGIRTAQDDEIRAELCRLERG